MKRMRVFLAICSVLQLAHRAGAQEIALKPENRVAVVNIGVVFTQYEKAKQFKGQMEKMLQPFKDQAERLKAEIAKLEAQQKDMQTRAEDKAKFEQAIITGKRKLEDLDREARAKIGKQQEEHLIALYKEVVNAVKEHAETHGIQIVLGYGEPPDADLFTFANINRKLTGMDMGGSVPLYFRPGIDISQHVVDSLNGALLRQSRPSDARLAQRRELRPIEDRATTTLPQRSVERR